MVSTPLAFAIPKRKLATIIAILKSRRLLSDHSEVLEECLANGHKDFETSWLHKYSNGISCSLLITSSIVTSKFVSKGIGVALGAISSGYAIMCLTKLVLYGQLWIVHSSINHLLGDFDEFDACMRRSISYFRENAYFQSTHQSSAVGIITTSKDLTACTKSLITIVEEICDTVVSLETKTTVPSKVEDLFSPLEDLSEYLHQSSNEPTVSNLKDLYNIFLYAQSHLLTRLSLFLMYNGAQSQLLLKAKCSALSRVIRTEIRRENSRYEQLTSTATTDHSHPNTIDHVAMEPILNLKSYSISASSKILAIASECRRIDDIVQSVHQLNGSELTKILPSIRQIENAFQICQSEYQRFVVAYYKAMNINYDDHCSSNGQATNGDSEFTAENEMSFQLKLKEIEPDEEEFFTSTERTSDDESKESNRNRRCWDDELTEKNIKVVKQRFKPVLHQLKGKIEPIAMSLRERERNHLLAKGIDPSEFVDCNILNEGFRSCSDSDGEDDNVRHKKPNRFEDMRKFLEAKSQISLILMRSANDNFLNEDILE